MERVICLVVGYAFGLIETGYFYGKIKGVDIRNHGSGNAGTTNALRTFGAKAGAITFIGDFIKAALACGLAYLIFKGQGAEYSHLLMFYAGLGTILGHDFPVYLGFKGGKGIASTAGTMVVVSPVAAIFALVTFVVIALTTKYVSLASLLAVTVVSAGFIITGQTGILGLSGNYLLEAYGILAVIFILAFVKHRANIGRLLHGNERKLNLKSKGEINE